MNTTFETFFIKKRKLINVAVCIILLALPYYLFDGKLYIGGDDTRLYYVYPYEFLKNISFFSWYNFSTVGAFNPNHFSIPFTFIWSILSWIVKDKTILDYLSFSAPLIFGFIYFQKFIFTLFNKRKYSFEIFIGSLVYIFSPILFLNQLTIFLYAAWLIAVIPIVCFYFARYVQTASLSEIVKCSLYCVVFSIAINSIPWIAGFLLPVLFSIAITLPLYSSTVRYNLVKKTIFFTFILTLTQTFWLIPFALTFLGSGNYGGIILSEVVANTFRGNVEATSTGSALFPFINMFHRQIAFDFSWDLKNVFVDYYDKIIFINIVYIFITFGGIFFAKKVLSKDEIKKYTTIMIAFITVLFLFTVNIGPLKNLFLSFEVIPGIAMFRNFIDKFALSYVLIFSSFFTFNLIILAQKFPKKRMLVSLVLCIVLFINYIPIKSIIIHPLWKTDTVYTNTTIPDEYIKFMSQISSEVPSTATILTLPFNIGSYSFIQDSTSDNVYAGTSPVKIFSGRNDLSGSLSLPGNDVQIIEEALLNKEYQDLPELFEKYNISYIFVTNDLPSDLKKSYLFRQPEIADIDKKLIEYLGAEEIIKSKSGKYTLYALNQNGNVLRSDTIVYQKVNQTLYNIQLKNIKESQILEFMDTFNSNWYIYPQKYTNASWCKKRYEISFNKNECVQEYVFISMDQLAPVTSKPLFDSSHRQIDEFGNRWTVTKEEIESTSEEYYRKNSDGSIDAEFLLVFKPQIYFYLGSLITFLSLVFLITFSLRNRKK